MGHCQYMGTLKVILRLKNKPSSNIHSTYIFLSFSLLVISYMNQINSIFLSALTFLNEIVKNKCKPYTLNVGVKTNKHPLQKHYLECSGERKVFVSLEVRCRGLGIVGFILSSAEEVLSSGEATP